MVNASKTTTKRTNTNVPTARTKRQGKPKKNAREAYHERRQEGFVNEYLETLLEPWAHTGAKIPDDSLIESSSLTTRHILDVQTDPQGNAYYAFSPKFVPPGAETVCSAGLHFVTGLSGGISCTSFDTITANGGVGVTLTGGVEPISLLSTPTRREVRNTFAAIRPVSFGVKVICTEAALTAQGSHFAGLWPRGQMPAQLSDGTFAPPTHVAALQLSNGPTTIDDVASGDVQTTNLTESMQVIWRPQDSNDFEYSPTMNNNTVGSFFFNGYQVGTTGNTAVPGYWFPWKMRQAFTSDTTFIEPSDLIDWDESLPYIVYGIRGATASATVITIEFIINWEAIPVSTETKIVASTASPANQAELQQATNLMSRLPPVKYPDVPNDAACELYRAAEGASGHLYDKKVHPKKAVEGTSFLEDVGDFVSDNWSTIGSAGAALLALL